MVVVLLNDRNMGAHADDAGVDGLAVEVFVALLIHVGLAGGDAAGDDAAVAQSVDCDLIYFLKGGEPEGTEEEDGD